jgi:ankyrin repeat protein
VLPHDKALKSAYFRFEVPEQLPFFEHSERQSIVASVKTWSQSATGFTLAAQAASLLESDNFPATPEDHIALASLASLLKALVTCGYMHEAELVADAISNFILFEGASGGHGSFLKAITATKIETFSGTFRSLSKAYEFLDLTMQGEGSGSAAQALNGLMTWHFHVPKEGQPPQEVQTPSDYAAGAYFYLTLAGIGDQDTLQNPNYQPLFRQLSSAVGMHLEVTPVFISRMQALLELSNLAALCEAGTVELLRGCRRLLYNGAIIRHLHKTLITTPLDDVAECILSPIANALALSVRVNNWTPLRDDGIASLLKSGSVSSNNPWSFVNLAIERIRLKRTLDSQDASSRVALSASEDVLSLNANLFEARKSTLATLSVKNGYFGLLTKCLTLENLTVPLSATNPDPSLESLDVFNRTLDSDGNNLLHLSTRLGFTKVVKLIIDCLGMTGGKTIINSGNARGQTPLHLACMHRAPRGIFTLLWILGADSNVKCNLGRTPLHYCFPEQQLLPSPWNVVLQGLEAYALPTTVPIDLPKAYGPYGKGKGIDPRTFDFRAIIRDLVLRKAYMTITDKNGMTPLHLAAREGWGDNLDIFLIQTGGEFLKSQEICLQLRDAAGFTVLDYARKTGVRGALRGGENIVVAEMKKREMDTSSKRLVTPTNTVRTEPRPINVHIPSPGQSEETAPATQVLPPGVTFQPYPIPIRPAFSQPSPKQHTTIEPTGQNRSENAPQQSAFVRPKNQLPSPSSTISTYSGSSPAQASLRAAHSPPAPVRFYPEASASFISQNTSNRQPVQQSQTPPAQANPSQSLSNRPVSSNSTNEGLKEKKQSSNLFKRMLR